MGCLALPNCPGNLVPFVYAKEDKPRLKTTLGTWTSCAVLIWLCR